jgi:hypothetical protein
VKLVKAMPKPDVSQPSAQGGASAVQAGAATSQDQLEETPGLWVLEKNWRHRLENASAAADALDVANGIGTLCVGVIV